MRASTCRRLACVGLGVAAWLTRTDHAQAGPQSEVMAAAAETSQMKPASERVMAEVKTTTFARKAGVAESSSKGRPVIRGERIPEALRGSVKTLLDARIERDLVAIRGLRTEALELLTKFVAETPRDSGEMPEAMMRLGELRWEVERDGFLARFEAWEARPVDQRGPTPQTNFTPARDLFGHVLSDYPWFAEYDLALYADGFLATQQDKHDEALARFERILKEYPRSRFTPDAHMIRGETLLAEKYDYAGALSRLRGGAQVPGDRPLRARAVQERLVPLASRQHRRGRPALRQRLRALGHGRAERTRGRRARQEAARRAPGRGARSISSRS